MDGLVLRGRMEVAKLTINSKGTSPVTHRNAPLTVEGRRRLIERCQSRSIAHVAAEMGISPTMRFQVGQ